MPSIHKILVANRGEIAVRVMRSAQKMDIRCIAVYSDADRKAPFVLQADEAYYLGPSPSSDSYLSEDKILSVALQAGADAIHPGYGFLSENARFARKVAEAGLIFIGPSPHSIEIMGSKLAAKEAVKGYGIPMVPGTEESISDLEEAKLVADHIGFPLLIKASAGGGGKGMRIVQDKESLHPQMERAMSEALSSFGDSSVFIEKYITRPKHIEIQILADQEGNTIHLLERECSVQRRHQKVIEEAPSPFISAAQRQKIGEAAVKVARSCNYTGAGTVEFLVDADHNFYFLEMNTRLQVEHPVTELITGLDLVEWQIRIARGETLHIHQDDVKVHGHAIELRVYAEDPQNQFLPSIGTLEEYTTPTGPHVRVDDGYRQGQEIPIFYDPMIAKLIVWGEGRLDAMDRMLDAIGEYRISGLKTTLPFGTFTLQHPVFRDGSYTTNFVDQYYYPSLTDEADSIHRAIAAVALKAYEEEREKLRPIPSRPDDWHQNRN